MLGTDAAVALPADPQRVVTSTPTPALSSPTTSLILGIVLLPITHLSWYWFFLHKQALDVRNRPTYGRSARVERAQEHKYDSLDRLVFYAICVWLVPFYVFLSLSGSLARCVSLYDAEVLLTGPPARRLDTDEAVVALLDADGGPIPRAARVALGLVPAPLPAAQVLSRARGPDRGPAVAPTDAAAVHALVRGRPPDVALGRLQLAGRLEPRRPARRRQLVVVVVVDAHAPRLVLGRHRVVVPIAVGRRGRLP